MSDARRSRQPANPPPRWDEPCRERSGHNRQQGSRDNCGGGRERIRDRRAYRSRSRSRSRQGRAGDRSRSPPNRRYNDRSVRDSDKARDSRAAGWSSGGYRDRGRDYYRNNRADRYDPRDSRDRRRTDDGDDDSHHRSNGRDLRDRRRRSASPRKAANSSPTASAGGGDGSSRPRPAHAASSAATAMPVRDGRPHEARHASPVGGDARSDGEKGRRNTLRGDAAREAGPRDADDDNAGVGADDADEAAMQAMLGFGGFASTKGKKIAGNNVSGLHKEKKTEYRQYMNRQGGFNRPLSPTR